jgi:hypothetical protein
LGSFFLDKIFIEKQQVIKVLLKNHSSFLEINFIQTYLRTPKNSGRLLAIGCPWKNKLKDGSVVYFLTG